MIPTFFCIGILVWLGLRGILVWLGLRGIRKWVELFMNARSDDDDSAAEPMSDSVKHMYN